MRKAVAAEFRQAFATVDAVMTPTTVCGAFPIGERRSLTELYAGDKLTVSANLAGLPAISVPAGLDAAGMPLGLQIIAPAFAEDTMFRCAAALERCAGFVSIRAADIRGKSL